MSTHKHRFGSREPFWRRMIRLWRRSGLSVRAFCEREGLAEPTFYAWRRAITERDAVADATATAFVPVRVTDESTTAAAELSPAAALELVVGAGRRLRVGAGFDGPTLLRLLALLEEGRS
jgi:transposase